MKATAADWKRSLGHLTDGPLPGETTITLPNGVWQILIIMLLEHGRLTAGREPEVYAVLRETYAILTHRLEEASPALRHMLRDMMREVGIEHV
jgi:hypothetical protein